MTLLKPFFISSRLLPAIKVGDVTISLDPSRYVIYLDSPQFEYVDKSFRPGAMTNYQRAFAAVLSFLSAAGEAYRYNMRGGRRSENADMFPDYVNEWAYQNQDELTMLEIELEEGEDLIIDND